MMVFKDVDTNASFPTLETEIRQWWEEHRIIEKTLEGGDRARPFVFFEGPPSANGKPGVHHLEARVCKDIVNRFHRMLGEKVIGARGGWDTHGLPIELQAEKMLGFKGKGDIERYGVEAFNQRCRELVFEYINDWEQLTDRVGFWLDLKDSYATFHNSYIESGWWIFKTLWERGLLFRDYKVTMHCPRCGTSLADHEVAQGFKDNVDDPSVWVRFRIRATAHPHAEGLAGASFLTWTTTPWTVPSNAGLAVKPGATYVLVEHDGERLVLAEALAHEVLGEGHRVLETFAGEQLVGLRYENLFKGVPAPGDVIDWETAWRVVADDFVSLQEGTGIVHISPAYGDLEIGCRYDLPTLFSVKLDGNMLDEFDELGFGGLFFKEADPTIIANLQERGLLFRSGRVKHSYPFCWRCETPLLYYAKRSWYIRTTAMKEQLVANNQLINWVPAHIKDGRFGNWLDNNIDWAVSRERYWGTPLPIWTCETCGEVAVIGSVKELSERAGEDLSQLDLHRPFVDAPSWACPSCGDGTMRRVADVADAWFDSGAMPVAQWHYPFANQDVFAVAGQADFISEAIDQTRGWFYTLHALSTLLFDRPAFKNVICLGHILDIKGEKMSKSRGNAVDPWDLIHNYGADATRWYMYASAPPYNPRRFAPEHVGDILRQFMLTLWNTHGFFTTYANLDGVEAADLHLQPANLQPIDRWALASLNRLVRDVTADLHAYDIYMPTQRIEAFVEELSNWYVRRNRRRFWRSESDADKQAAYATLYTCLTTLAHLLAPFMPFLSEALYGNLVANHHPNVPGSVHLARWPEANETLIDAQLLADTALLLEIASLGRAARASVGVRVRQPLSELLVQVPHGSEGLHRLEDVLRDELNVKTVRFLDVGNELVEYRFKPNLPVIGKKYGRLVPAIKAALEALEGEAAAVAAQAIEAGQRLAIQGGGQTLLLEPSEVLLTTVAPQGYTVAEGNGLVVAINTTLTPELRLEGQARDFVRYIQDARKSAGFVISERINIRLQPHGGLDLVPLLATYGDYIRAETLAESLMITSPEPDSYTAEVELDGGTMLVSMRQT